MQIETEKYVERILIVLNNDGSFKGAHEESIVINYDISVTPKAIVNAQMLPAKGLDETSLKALIPSESSLLSQLQDANDKIIKLNENLVKSVENEKNANNRVSELEAEIIKLKDQITNANNTLIINGIPQKVTAAQGKLALYAAGLYEQAANAATSASGTVLIYWNSWPTWERNHPLIALIGTAIGLDEIGIDNLFIDANTY